MAPRVSVQGKTTSMFMADAGFKLSVLQDKGNISLNVRNIFNRARFGGTRTTAQLISEFQRNFMKGPLAMINFSYRFGNSNLGQKDKKKGPEESEDFQGGGEMN